MKRVHLLAVEGPAGEFEPLVAAARELGLRVGWLDLAAEASPDPVDGPAGTFRRVAVSPGRVVAVKPLAGPPVLRDLVRGHFLGCTAVLVTGTAAEGLPRLAPDGLGGDAWRLGDHRYPDSATLARALRSPRLNPSG